MTWTTDTASEFKADLRKSLEQLQALRDEIRLEAHLAGMEAKQRWDEELEPLLEEAERSVKGVTATARQQVNDTLARWRAFYEVLAPNRPESKREPLRTVAPTAVPSSRQVPPKENDR